MHDLLPEHYYRRRPERSAENAEKVKVTALGFIDDIMYDISTILETGNA